MQFRGHYGIAYTEAMSEEDILQDTISATIQNANNSTTLAFLNQADLSQPGKIAAVAISNLTANGEAEDILQFNIDTL